jgi:5-bromo-4-chloroindolyl phosphate hydrolysis protein
MEKIKSFKELRMWQKGVEIVKDVYTLTREFPKEEI